ncbi:hypothetical protein EQH57_0881 [Dictyocoela roeselum]|nr:hypothetical protein EQH57_0881 [Dictyocoela roeselum]
MIKNFSYQHECFKSVEDTKNFLIDNGIIKDKIECDNCSSTAPITISTVNGNERIIYRCISKNCRKRIPLFKINIRINEYLFILYCLLLNIKYSQIKSLVNNISNETISNARKFLRKQFKKINNNEIVFGGYNKCVEADETVLCRRKTIRCPTSTDDETLDTVWIFGIIDNTPEKNILVRKVDNRQAPTLTAVLENKINVCSLFCTDGYPSYPLVAESLGVTHKVVNHTEGFKAPDGTHTNNIESLWATLKSEMRKQHGVKRDEIDGWLEEFTFRQRFLKGSDANDISEIFLKILINTFN